MFWSHKPCSLASSHSVDALHYLTSTPKMRSGSDLGSGTEFPDGAGKILDFNKGYKQSFKTKMLTIIPKESPAFAIEHAHYFTQEAIIINETCCKFMSIGPPWAKKWPWAGRGTKFIAWNLKVIPIHWVGPQATPMYSQSWEAAALGKLQDYPDKDCLQENYGAGSNFNRFSRLSSPECALSALELQSGLQEKESGAKPSSKSTKEEAFHAQFLLKEDNSRNSINNKIRDPHFFVIF
eukprot:bmy_17915T0